MKHVDFDPTQLVGEQKTWWDDWTRRADEARRKIITTWETDGRVTSSDFKNEIWTDLKVWLLENVFGGNCAYCETNVAEARQPGHAEHFRPKGGVKNKIRTNGDTTLVVVKTTDPSGNEINHPGYFWLAYSWENLVPSCNDCNTSRGKNNQFPVANDHLLLQPLSDAELASAQPPVIESTKHPGFYYLAPKDLDSREQRLLLHPYFDEPRNHIIFGIKGTIAAKEIDGEPSEQGKQSIKVCELDARPLRRARQHAQVCAFNLFQTGRNNAVNQGMQPDEANQAGRAAIAQVMGENWEYSVAIKDFLRLYQR